MRSTYEFAVANYMSQKVILSGGVNNDSPFSDKLWIFHIEKNKWYAAPKLNYGKKFHSSCCLSEFAYVFGGVSYSLTSTSSLWTLKVEENGKFLPRLPNSNFEVILQLQCSMTIKSLSMAEELSKMPENQPKF